MALSKCLVACSMTGLASVNTTSLLKLSRTSVVLNTNVFRTYRGSNRDNRKRAKNQMIRINQELRERGLLQERPVYDRQKFMLKYFDQESFCLQNRLGIHGLDKNLILSVFNCSSSMLPNIESNEKLALQGYYFTSMFATAHLLKKYPLLPASLLKTFKKKILSRKHVTSVTEMLSLADFILVDPDLPAISSEKHLPFAKADVVCDVFYALVAAIYNVMGQNVAESFISDFLLTPLDLHTFFADLTIYKPRETLAEMCELASISRPTARIIHQLAETSTLPVYVVGIFSGTRQLGQSGGPTAHEAKEAAYLDSILRLLSYDGKELTEKYGEQLSS